MGRGLALCVAAAACAPAAELDGIGQEIIGGSSDTGKDLAVGFLISRHGDGTGDLCSASMITRRVVMTAAHCVDNPAEAREIWFLDSYNVRTGERVGLVDSQRRVSVREWIHPQWQPPSVGHDIALLLLDKPMPAQVAPLPWNRSRIGDDYLGMDLRMVGFGHRVYSSDDPVYLKLTATNTLASLGAVLEVRGSTRITCQGDSGGPALMTIGGREVIAGITSYGDEGCAMYGAFSRVDLYLDEIDAFIAAGDPQPAQGCGADGACGYPCSAVDPDCPCAGDGQCVAECTKPEEDPDCPQGCGAGNACVRTGCPLKDPDCGDKAQGAACTKADECAAGVCAPFDDGKICSQVCESSSACPAATSCTGTSACPRRTVAAAAARAAAPPAGPGGSPP